MSDNELQVEEPIHPDDDGTLGYCEHGNRDGSCPYCEAGPFGDDWGN